MNLELWAWLYVIISEWALSEVGVVVWAWLSPRAAMRISFSLYKIAHSQWTPSVGLEIHAQICSRNKIFSRGPVRSRDLSPNSALSLFDVAIPGTMPVSTGHVIIT